MKRTVVKAFLYTTLSIMLSAYSCKKDAKQPMPPVNNGNNSNNNSGDHSFLALGDSYTIGQSVAVDERFPAQTQSLLAGEGLKVTSLTYIATTGWTTTNLSNAIEQQNPKGPFDIVTLLIGVNDQHQNRDTTGYSERFTKLLEKAIQLAGDRKDHVFVLSIPDYSVTPYGANMDSSNTRKQIDLFNSINLKITNTYNISYTDITPISREAKQDPSLLANDGLHPSGKMYRRWAELLKPKIKGQL